MFSSPSQLAFVFTVCKLQGRGRIMQTVSGRLFALIQIPIVFRIERTHNAYSIQFAAFRLPNHSAAIRAQTPFSTLKATGRHSTTNYLPSADTPYFLYRDLRPVMGHSINTSKYVKSAKIFTSRSTIKKISCHRQKKKKKKHN